MHVSLGLTSSIAIGHTLIDLEELNKLDNLIAEEKRSIAREYFCEAWENATTEGIDIDIIADELVHGVLVEIARIKGDAALNKFVAGLSEREARGAFVPDRVLQ